jgi:hypothetical protein
MSTTYQMPPAVTNSTVACFADDTKSFRRIDSITDAMLLQDDINNLESWSKSSGLGKHFLTSRAQWEKLSQANFFPPP